MKFNTNAINAAIISAFASADKAADARVAYQSNVATLRGLLKGADRETIKGFVCPIAAARYDATYVDGKWEDSKCAAKRWANRMIADVIGVTGPAASSKTIVRLTGAQKAAVKALLLAFGGDAKAAKAAIQ